MDRAYPVWRESAVKFLRESWLVLVLSILFAGMLLLTFVLWRNVLKLRIVNRSREVRRAR